MATKVFHRKTKRGSILKIVREHYLRDDIACGQEDCHKCDDIYRIAPPNAYLSKKPRLDSSKQFKKAHIVIPAATALIQQIDVIADVDFGQNIVIMQSVLADVKAHNFPLFARLKDMIKENDRKIYVFCNEFHCETYRNRMAGETAAQYSDRLFKIAINWYKLHLDDIEIVPITSEVDEELESVKMIDYVSNMPKNVNLIDKVVVDEKALDLTREKFYYDEHLPLSTLLGGIKKGIYFQGTYSVSRNNYLEGSVPVNMTGHNKLVWVLIQGREHINRSITGDDVVIELLPESEWKGRSNLVIDNDQELAEDEDIKPSSVSSDLKTPTGKVVGIIKRNWRPYVGALREKKNVSQSVIVTQHLFLPSNKQIPMIKIETRQYEALVNQRIVVAIDSWPRDSMNPKGHYVRAVGEMNDEDTEKEVILLEYDIPHHQFSPAVLKCLPSDPNNWKVPEEEYTKRLDLRDYTVCSVDPPGCTDIDDALHAKDLGNGIFEIGVHIADVSFFVKSGTPLDIEAANRGTTVYLTKARIDMIPGVLSGNLCSLVEGKERLTFSVIWKINRKTGEILDTTFRKTIIRSRAALEYKIAQMKIDSKDNDEVAQSLRRLNSVAKLLKQKRIEKGAIVLASAGELRFIEVESETHDKIETGLENPKIGPKTIKAEVKPAYETNSMIEEFMLLANISVARKLHDQIPEVALLRRHRASVKENCEKLLVSAKARGFDIDVSSGLSFAKSLEKARDSNNEYFNTMLRMIAITCMNRADYVCSGKETGDDSLYHHYGIAADIYTHFTSPIRRYADLVVHRLLGFAIEATELDSSLMRKDTVHNICKNINMRHEKAQFASRASTRLHTLMLIKNAQLVEEHAYLFDVNQNCIDIFVPALAFHINYFIDRQADWTYDEKDLSQTFVPLNRVLRQFSSVKVQMGVSKQNTEWKRNLEKIEVRIIDPPIDKRFDE